MEVLSKEIIKSSSSSPQHLKKINLSMLDQIAPPTYVHLVFFYETPNHSDIQSQISQNLKHSLSNVLTNFPPLAGRIIQQNSSIDCNIDGIEYVQTRVHAHMSDVLDNPDPVKMQTYVPSNSDNPREIPLCIQVNLFECGGIAIGVCMSHKIADMKSFVIFMNAWAATCRNGVESLQPPSFDLSSHFPPVDPSKLCSEHEQSPPESETAKNFVTKRFVFNREMLLALKRIGASSQVTNPSRIEALTAFLWRNFIISNKERNLETSTKTKFAAMHAVDVRSRASPPLPEQCFGNACMQAIGWSKSGEQEYSVLITELRNAIKNVDCDYIDRMKNIGDERFDHFSEEENEGFFEVCIYSSWCRFPMYEVDYGWGKPHWVSTCPAPHTNLTVFMDTKCGDGIEAWVNMGEEDMALIEKNYRHLQSNAALDHFQI